MTETTAVLAPPVVLATVASQFSAGPVFQFLAGFVESNPFCKPAVAVPPLQLAASAKSVDPPAGLHALYWVNQSMTVCAILPRAPRLVGRDLVVGAATRAEFKFQERRSADKPHDQDGADSVAAAICSGLMGVELNSILNGASASDTALAMTTGGEIALPSPTPLTPSGLSGEGECK